ncbi:MAG: bifunctional methylenetetrahydrofolate dehydrogenase/methenyltetrahydrofolate cyclohydrolase FolD [Gammaproteobacteria bacterium]|nr:MAG: bifunctional methylenetetrahydrofolate dehydrogenase/methenyltetrahydrofolate cyclohydrolase FolD [Gammaproteobacteria bacterium]
MSAHILDGKAIAESLKTTIKDRVSDRLASGLRVPGLAVIQVGKHPASNVYVRHKRQSCEQCGILSLAHELPEETTQTELLALIGQLNSDPLVDGILVQLPLPRHIAPGSIIEAISPMKDVDGFHPENLGLLALGRPRFRSCTPKGIMTLLANTETGLSGLDAVVLGRSSIVGRPIALELISANCTVTVCHSRTRDLADKIGQADLLVAAIGKASFVKGDWLKKGAIVIDVGINRLANGALVGDVDFKSAAERAAWITPVPGGVGPMTVASLMENTLQSAELSDKQ